MILAKVATLKELDDHWTVADIFMGNEMLDIQAEAQRLADEAAK